MSSVFEWKGVTYHEGSVLISTEKAYERGICDEGYLFRIAMFGWSNTGLRNIGLFSPTKLSKWHELDGYLPDHQGWWIEVNELGRNFTLHNMRVEVIEEIRTDDKPLLGKKGNYLCPYVDFQSQRMASGCIFRPSHVFMEFDDYVGGLSADGIGKRGHCILVPTSSIKFEEEIFARDLMII